MIQYHDLLRKILLCGDPREDRTGTGTLSLFGAQLRFDLREGFPLLTTKKVHWKSVVHELLWFIKGEGNVKYLRENGVKIWDPWADENGDLGPVYGVQWRSWRPYERWKPHIDQLSQVIETIKRDPSSRRLIVSSWNPGELSLMALPPCHCLFQFHVAEGRLSCHLYQRSADAFLGLPFNIASYALLTHMVAKVTGLTPGDFIHSLGDVHVYNNHFPQVHMLLNREPRRLPIVAVAARDSINDFVFDDIKLEAYDPWPAIPAEVAV